MIGSDTKTKDLKPLYHKIDPQTLSTFFYVFCFSHTGIKIDAISVNQFSRVIFIFHLRESVFINLKIPLWTAGYKKSGSKEIRKKHIETTVNDHKETIYRRQHVERKSVTTLLLVSIHVETLYVVSLNGETVQVVPKHRETVNVKTKHVEIVHVVPMHVEIVGVVSMHVETVNVVSMHLETEDIVSMHLETVYVVSLKGETVHVMPKHVVIVRVVSIHVETVDMVSKRLETVHMMPKYVGMGRPWTWCPSTWRSCT